MFRVLEEEDKYGEVHFVSIYDTFSAISEDEISVSESEYSRCNCNLELGDFSFDLLIENGSIKHMIYSLNDDLYTPAALSEKTSGDIVADFAGKTFADEDGYISVAGSVDGTTVTISMEGQDFIFDEFEAVIEMPDVDFWIPVYFGEAAGYFIMNPLYEEDEIDYVSIAVIPLSLVHVHGNWTYSASDNVITATCGGTSSTCDLDDNKVTLTLTASSANYSGSAVTASYGTDEASAWETATGSVAPTITYEKKGADSTWSAIESAPSEVGEYRAVAKVTKDTTDYTAYKEFTISKAEISSVAFTEPTVAAAGTPATATGLAISATENYTGAISWTPADTTFGYNKAYAATVTLTAKDNYKFAGTVTVPTGWTKSASSTETSLVLTKTYDATAKAKITSITAPSVTTQLTAFTTESARIAALPTSVTVAVEDSSVESMAITWALKDSTTYSTASEAENTFVWTITASEYANFDTNGKILTGEVTLKNPVHQHTWNFTADEAVITATCTGFGDCTVENGNTTGVSLTLSASSANYSGNPVEATMGTTAWAAAGLTVPTIIYEAKEGSELTGGNAVNVGTYTAKVTVGTATATKDFEITKAAASVGTTPTGKDNLTYSGSAQALVNAGTNVVGGTLQYSTTETGTYSATIPTGTNAGSYSVWYKVVGDANHNDTTAAKVDVTIAKATPTITTNPTASAITYGQTLVDSALTGGVASTDGSFAWEAPTTAPAVADSNTTNYTVVFTPTDAANYNTVECSVTLTVNKKPVAASIAIIAPKANETAQTELVATEDFNVAAITWSPDLKDGKFEYSKEYTAEVALSLKDTANTTTDGVTFTVEGAKESGVTFADGMLTVTFVKTGSAPSSGGSSTPTITVPVTGDENTVKVQASVSGSAATVKDIKDSDLTKVSGGESVEIDLTGLNKNIDTAKIPTTTVEKIAEQGGMSVKLSTATVTFDSKATETISEQAKGNTIELVVDDIQTVSLNAVQKEAVQKLDAALIIDAYLVSNGTRLCSESKGGFGGGKATVALPYEIKGNRTAANYSVYYVDDAGKLEKLNASYDADAKAFVFDIEHFSNYVVAYDENAMLFVDVAEGSFYYDAVLWAAKNGITTGADATHFNPNGGTTRAHVVTFLWRAAGCPEPKAMTSFADVEAGSYYEKAVAWALENGITKGTTETTFSPDKICTRGQIVTFLARFAGVADEAAGYTHGFTDVKSTNYFNNAVAWAKDNKVTEGTSATTFSPNTDCTRAQVVTFLYRWMVK